MFDTVTWLKDGKVLEESAKYQIKAISKTKFQLQVLNCALPDIGQYNVKVAGKKAEIVASFSNNVVPSGTSF